MPLPRCEQSRAWPLRTDKGSFSAGEGGDEWLDGGTWTGSRYRCLADALVHLRPITAWRLAGNAPTNHSRLAHFAAALIDDALPLAIAKALRRRMVHPVEPLLTPFVASGQEWRAWGSRDDTTVWTDRRSRERLFELYRTIALEEIGWRDRHVFAANGIENRSPLNDLELVEFLASVPQWVMQFDGRNRAILRRGLKRSGLPAIAARRDKGFYNEQLIVGLSEKEPQRFERGWRRVAALNGVQAEALTEMVRAWQQRPRLPGSRVP